MSASTDVMGAIKLARKDGRTVDPVIEELLLLLAGQIDAVAPAKPSKAAAPAANDGAAS